MNFKCYYNSKIGKIILESNGEALIGLWFDSSRFIDKLNKIDLEYNENLEIFKLCKNWLDMYFGGKNPNPNDIPIQLNGTDFSKKVWRILQTIPYGKTITYGDIAKEMERINNIKKMSAQAIGHAVGCNPISIIIPCHRVIGANGKLVGYSGGIEKKIALLKFEKVL